jgi:hypothetical protein
VDVRSRVTFLIASISSRAATLIHILVLAGSILGCSSAKPHPTISLAPESLAELKQQIASVRGLEFKRDVAYAMEPAEATAASHESVSTEAYRRASLVNISLSHVYKRLGLLPESTDFARALADYSRLQRVFDYEARRDLIVIAPDAARVARAIVAAPNRNAEQFPAVWGLTRALHEQHFHWQERLKKASPEDQELAFRALASGDMLLVGVAYLQGSPQTPKPPGLAQTIARWTTALEKLGAHLPEVLRQELVFPYSEGSQFVQWAYASKGWAGVNTLFADPPVSTSPVLHPERYYVKRENPLDISLPGLAQKIKEPRVVDQTMGEYLIQQLLTSSLSLPEATQTAAGWTGDRLSAYREGENSLTAWVSAWKTDEAAQVFCRAYQTLLEQRHACVLRCQQVATTACKPRRPETARCYFNSRGSLCCSSTGQHRLEPCNLPTLFGRVSTPRPSPPSFHSTWLQEDLSCL